MKKIKEACIYVIPLVLLTCFAILFPVMLYEETPFISKMNYLTIILNTIKFVIARIYGGLLLCSLGVVSIFYFIFKALKVKALTEGILFHFINCIIGCISAVAVTLIKRAVMPGLNVFANEMQLSDLPLTVPEAVIAVHVGVMAAFVLWLALQVFNYIRLTIKSKAQNNEVGK